MAGGTTAVLDRVRSTSAWALGRDTFAVCWRYRVTGLAAEAAFFALVSLPPLVLGLIGAIGFIGDRLGDDVVEQVREAIVEAATAILTPDTVEDFVEPLLEDVLTRGRFDITVLGVVITLWAGSRCLNVYVDTISIMHGMGGRRGPFHIRVVSFALYLAALLVGVVVLPLLVIGPGVLKRSFPEVDAVIDVVYWPLVLVLALAFLATLYHVSVPAPFRWRRALPGALFAFAIWAVGALVLRLYLSTLFSGTSVYGGFAAPVAVLFWAYLTALAVLIGAALNAVVDARATAHDPADRRSRREEQLAEKLV